MLICHRRAHAATRQNFAKSPLPSLLRSLYSGAAIISARKGSYFKIINAVAPIIVTIMEKAEVTLVTSVGAAKMFCRSAHALTCVK